MRRSEASRRLSAAVVGIAIIMSVAFSQETALRVKAAGMPGVTNLEVAVSEDGSGVIAECSYQNYTEQSGCEMRLYLYKLENGKETVESQKTIAYAEQGKDSTPPKQVENGVYQASVTIDDGVTIRQINSTNYYRVSKSEGNYIVTVEAGREELIQLAPENDRQKKVDFSCRHECEYILIEQATPIKDAVQAYQCMKCGAVFEYIDVPNSAYAAFLKETARLILNAEQEEVTITTDRWMSFDQTVFEAMKVRPDLSVKINYRYHGENYLLVIPAGTDVEILMDENGFGGFRYMEEMLKQTLEAE